MYPTRRVDVTFAIEDDEGNELNRIDSGTAYSIAEQVAEAAAKDDVVLIKTYSDDQIYWEQEVLVGSLEDVEQWALYQQDENAGVECAVCEKEIGFESGCSSPSGSMHKGCASQHESKHPAGW
jgi:hypothetical protein